MGPLPDSWLAARMADLTPDLQVIMSIMSVDGRELPLSAIPLCQLFPCHLGLPRPTLSINLYVKGCLAPLEHSTCPNHRSLLSFRMRSRSSMPSRTSSSLDLVVTMSCGLTLQICLIIACCFAADAGGLALSMAKFRWHGALRSAHKSCTQGHVF